MPRSATPASRIRRAGLRKSARELFASALETPGGLKVQTIHALCTRLLQQFPFEANVPARFTVLDDRDQTEMMERASLAVMLDASRAPDSAIGRALLAAMANAADVTFKDVVREACLSRDHFMAWTDAAGSAEAAAAQVSAVLGRRSPTTASKTSSARSSMALTCRDRAGRRSRERSIPAAKTERDNADRLRAALPAAGAAQVDEYLGVFLTDTDRTPRKSVVTKNFVRDNPAIGRRFDAEASRLGPLIEKRRAITTRDRTEALLHIAIAVAANYRREKLERGLLDYDDLIDKTLALLDKRRVRLGALQARPRRRSRADRRGAGHQPAAMGHHRAYHLGIHRRRGRARRRAAHRVRGRRREAVDLLVSGRGAAGVRLPAGGS